MTFFNNVNAYGYEINFNVNKDARTVTPVAKLRNPTKEANWEFIQRAEDKSPIVTWVALKQPDRELCTHIFTVQNGTWKDWGNWGHLNWFYSYPDDNLPKMKEMSQWNKYKRRIYFATHVIDSQCHWDVYYYGATYFFLWQKMRGYIYGFNWDPDKKESLDSLKGLNERTYAYPRFILMPGVFPDHREPEDQSIILYNNHGVGFGSMRASLNVLDNKFQFIETSKEELIDETTLSYHQEMDILVNENRA